MTTLRRTFRVAASPEQILQFVQLKLAGPNDRVARVRLDRVRARGFHLLRTAQRHSERAEWVAGARVRLVRTEDGTDVTIDYAGTVLRGSAGAIMALTFVMAALLLPASFLRDDDPESLLFGLLFLTMFAGFSWPIVTNRRRRDAYFAELADALQEVLAPLSDPEIAPIALRVAAEFHKETDDRIFERALENLRRVPATLALGTFLVAMFALAAWWGDTTHIETLHRMGGLRGEDLALGEYWRLLSSGFVHAGIKHLGGNLQLLFLCYFAEIVLGSRRFVVLFTLSVLGGSLAAALVTPPSVVVVGASGGLFGLAAAILLLTLREPRLLPGEHAEKLRGAFLALIGLNLLFSLLPGISLASHVGGALVGAALVGTRAITFGQTRIWRDEQPRPEVTRVFGICAAICGLALAGSVVLALAHGRPWLLAGP
ncbi:rhomboid family intramembrane serine protease [Nannocystis punicea]|uniref:Rhomboid family intramembrane serine protease n=1 Tax=Nannocystis punicea TaxID=2995304 RepID=A0ABY7H895_9BACT|nr:rhomboid family intramembrane serine protease [Nannocystis poenicansa]WAS95320.1 rhomboid family intramembrane serine protease [Nannocystis poenicansa]